MVRWRRRLVVIAAVVAVAALVVSIAGRKVRDDGPARGKPAVLNVPKQRGAIDPQTGVPQWLGQRGVGAQRIAGVVIDERGTPIRGATVRLSATHINARLVKEPIVVADESGHFDFGPQPAATYIVGAEMRPFTPVLLRVELRDPTWQPAPDQVRLVMHPCDVSIHGSILDRAGGTIPHAVIARGEGSLDMSGGAEADDNGAYELCIPTGGGAVRVSADGYAVHSEHIVAYGRTRRDFRLLPGAAVIGRVIRADDKSAVPGAIVRMRPADPGGEGVPLSATSDADGRFQFDAAAPGRHLVTALAEQLATEEPSEVTATIGAMPDEMVVEVAATQTVSGRVVEVETRTPIAGVTLMLSSTEARRSMSGPPPNVISQADGSFAFDHVLAGEYLVRGQSGGKVSDTSIKVETADVRDVVVELERGASIAGRVLSDGKPVEGAQVRVSDAMSQTDAYGRFTLLRLPAGTHELYAESKRVGAFTRGPSVTVTNGEQKTGIDLSLDLAASVSGVVVDQNDAPVSGVFLRFSLLHGADYGAATTADDGTFTANALSGGGDYIYEVREREQSSVVFPPLSGKRHPPIAVADGRTRVTGVRVKVRIERLAISGHIMDAAGKPVADATVRAYPRNEDYWHHMSSAITDERGAFTIDELPPGKYALFSTTAFGEGHLNDVAAGRKDVVLRLAALGGIDGTLEGFTSAPDVKVTGFHDGRRYRAEVTGTTFKLRNLPGGAYIVTAKPDGNSIVVEVQAGKTERVTLRPLEYGGIAAIVVDAKTRAPMAGIRCASALKALLDSATSSATATSDSTGAFRFDRAAVGEHSISCSASSAYGFAEVKVSKGQVARVEILMGAHDVPTRGYAGLAFEDQLGETHVKSVDANGPAARAGIAVGDVLRTIDGWRVPRGAPDAAMESLIESRVAKPIKLGLERGDKDFEVTLTLEARP